jgi:hypothetical protein
MDQVTCVLVLFVTGAKNCSVCPAKSVTLAGVTLTAGGISETVADSVMNGFAKSVAVTTTVCAVGIVAGAVYKPDELTVPAPAGLTDHDATDGPHDIELGPLAMQAENCTDCPPMSVAVRGVSEAGE